MKSYKQIAEAAKKYAGLEKEDKKGLPTAMIKKSKNAVDGDTVEGWDHPNNAVRKEETELTEATVKTQKYSWGTMKTVHHGSDFSIPLHPEHHQAISKLKDEQEHKFKDETGRHWVARRKGENVHFDTTGNGSMKTHVPMHTMKEEYENDIITEEDHAELARKASAEYRKAISRGDSVAANAANAEHIRHKKAAQLMRKKSHTPGEIEEASDHDPWHDAQENKKSAEAAKKQGDNFAYHLHMADHHENMAHWSMNRGRHHVANQHQAKADQHHEWSKSVKEEVELSEEHLVHVSDGSKYGDKPSKKDTDHVMSGAKTHGGEFDGHSDKGAYFKFKSQDAAKNFKRHVDSCPDRTCHADLHEGVDFNKWVSGGTKTTPKQKPVVEKEPQTVVKGSQIKFLNTFKEETQLDEKINLAKAGMGDVIKDFQKSDAPQFAGKTKEKRREMAIAAKLQADRQQNEGVIQPTGSDAIDVGVDKPKDTVVRDKKGKLVSFKHEGVWKKSTGTVTDKSGAQHGPMSQVRHLARSAMKTVKENVEDLDEAFVNGREYASQGVMHPEHAKMHKAGETRDFYAHGTGDKISGKVVKNDGKEVHIQADKMSGGKLHKFNVTSTLPKQQNEQAPVAPVPDRKYIKGTPEHKAYKATKKPINGHPTNVKEELSFDESGDYSVEPISYKDFMTMLEGRAQYMVKATHNKTGNTKVSTYVADKDESEYGVRSRAEREHKPMGYTIDSVRRKDVEAHGEGDEEETVSTQKRGRGRPAGSKSGARGPRIK